MSFLPPPKPNNIPDNSQWLGGIGAGSWFFLKKELDKFKITRFSKNGIQECTGIFIVDRDGFEIEKKYVFTYLSHCSFCTIIQNNITYKFIYNEDNNV
jgi:hypothetical protein